MKFLKDIITYLKHKEDINSNYSFHIGLAGEFPIYGSINESAGWRERLDFWRKL